MTDGTAVGMTDGNAEGMTGCRAEGMTEGNAEGIGPAINAGTTKESVKMSIYQDLKDNLNKLINTKQAIKQAIDQRRQEAAEQPLPPDTPFEDYAGYIAEMPNKRWQNPPPQVGNAFVFEIDTAKNSNNKTFTVPINSASDARGYDFWIEWGDGVTDEFKAKPNVSLTSNNLSHTYAEAGIYQISINGPYAPRFFRWTDMTTAMSNEITRIISFGELNLTEFRMINSYQITNDSYTTNRTSYSRCQNLTEIPDPLPRSFKNNARLIFYGASITKIPDNLFRWQPDCTDFRMSLAYLPFVEKIPQGLFDYNTKATRFTDCFRNCSFQDESQKPIPDNLFANCAAAAAFTACFRDTTAIKYMPDNLLPDAPEGSITLTEMFYNSADLRYWPAARADGYPAWGSDEAAAKVINMSYMFYSCHSITDVPAQAFFHFQNCANYNYLFYSNSMNSIGNAIFNPQVDATFNYALGTSFTAQGRACALGARLFAQGVSDSVRVSLQYIFCYTNSIPTGYSNYVVALPEGYFQGPTVNNLIGTLYGLKITNPIKNLFTKLENTISANNMLAHTRIMQGFDGPLFAEQDTKAAVDLGYLFYYSAQPFDLPAGLFKNIKVSNYAYMFAYCAVNSLGGDLFDSANSIQAAASATYFCRECVNLGAIDPTALINAKNISSLAAAFYNCINLSDIDGGIFASQTKCASFDECFKNCAGITEVPSGLFANCEKAAAFKNCFANSGAQTIGAEFLPAAPLQSQDLEGIFRDCANLTTASSDAFKYADKITSLKLAFRNAIKFEPPSDMFQHFTTNNALSTMEQALSNTAITDIDGDMLAYLTSSSLVNIIGLFSFCRQLQTVDPAAFRAFEYIKDCRYIFMDCPLLQNPPAGLFNSMGALQCIDGWIENCTSITALPTQLFWTNAAINRAAGFITGCVNMTELPEELFGPNTNNVVFSLYNASVYKNSTDCMLNNKYNIYIEGFTAPKRLDSNTPNGMKITTLPADLLANWPNITDLTSAFTFIDLSAIPQGFFSENTKITTLERAFANGTMAEYNGIRLYILPHSNYVSIPAGLLGGLKQLANINYMFVGRKAAAMPNGFFDYLPPSISEIRALFGGTEFQNPQLPARLRTTPAAANQLKLDCIFESSNISGVIPDTFFANMENVISIRGMFAKRASLSEDTAVQGAIPTAAPEAGCFDPLVNLQDMSYAFFGNTGARQAMPEGLAKNCVKCNYYMGAFGGGYPIAGMSYLYNIKDILPSSGDSRFCKILRVKPYIDGNLYVSDRIIDVYGVKYLVVADFTATGNEEADIAAYCAAIDPAEYVTSAASAAGSIILHAGNYYKVMTGFTSSVWFWEGFNAAITSLNISNMFDSYIYISNAANIWTIGASLSYGTQANVSQYTEELPEYWQSAWNVDGIALTASQCFRGQTLASNYAAAPSGWK
jgi:hypothetical protein